MEAADKGPCIPEVIQLFAYLLVIHVMLLLRIIRVPQFDGSENSPIVIADSPVKKRTHPEENNRYKFIHYKYVIQTMIITFISFSTLDDSHLEYHSESSSDERYPKSMFLQAALNYHQYFTL